MMARIGVYCGSFSPVHKGHIQIAREILKQGLADEVMIIATGDYWHKKDLILLGDRIRMLEMVKEEGMVIDHRYNSFPYTCQIFDQLQEDRPNDELVLIIGGDNLPDFRRWNDCERLLTYDFIVIPRDEIDQVRIRELMQEYHKENYAILEVENIDISSTYIRNNLNDYKKIETMLDRKVYDYLKNMNKRTTQQHEIIDRHQLLDGNGQLIEAGFARSQLLNYDRRDIKANALRIKEWDYYLIYNRDFAIALTIDDNSYMALDSISFLDFTVPVEHTNSPMKLFTMGKRSFPATSAQGDVRGEGKSYAIEFLKKDDRRILNFHMDNFWQNLPIEGSITLIDHNDESMVIATPFKESRTHFYYNQKINCMPAEGSFTFNDREYVFHKEDSFAVLDWGRGVWTYKNTWYWGSGSGMADGHRFGFNIGYGFGDTSAASENMLFYDGKSHKLSRVSFNIPMKDGKEDYMSPWTFTSDDGRFEMTFVPILDRASNTDFIILGSDQHQVFGRFSGKAVLDDGKVIEIKDFTGMAEKVMNKW